MYIFSNILSFIRDKYFITVTVTVRIYLIVGDLTFVLTYTAEMYIFSNIKSFIRDKYFSTVTVTVTVRIYLVVATSQLKLLVKYTFLVI